jgi:hypothetical protein
MRRRAFAVAITVAALLPTAALAQPSSPQKPAPPSADNRALAETLFFTGRGLMEAQRFAEACEKFAESYRLDAAAGTLLNLAVCHEKQGKIASAWGDFRQALVDARRMSRPDREKLALERIAALQPELPYLTIVVPPATRIAGLELTSNGVALEAAAWSTELPIDPGVVSIVARAPGFKPRTTSITMAARQHASVTIAPLEPAPVVRAAPEFWTGRRKGGVVAFAGGLVAIGAGSLFGLAALSERSKSDAACPVFDGERRCTSAGTSAMAKANTEAWASDIGFGLGAIGVAVGTILFFGGSSERGARSGDRAWTFDVHTAPGGASAAVSHAF